MKLILKKRGKDVDTRAKKTLKNAMTVMGGVAMRKNYRERAKTLVYNFLTEKSEQHYLLSKMRRRYQQMVWLQRMVHTKTRIRHDPYI